mmetsp:Transcript_16834/g.27920  ORF Transcript_16834/g.27920 Transcript_16834/m.27920 type:complete len:562 (-) Transcript_16834:271-1956(-)
MMAASKLRRAKVILSARFAARRVLGLSSHESHLLDVLNCCDGVMVASTLEQMYIVARQIGVGQTATVYRGLRRSDKSVRALKCFKLEKLRNEPLAVDALRAEVEILKALPAHKHIVSLHEVLSTSNTVVLAMEFVAGGDLLTPVEARGPYREDHARRLFAQIIQAVEHLHFIGVVHRDLKLENICFTDSTLMQVKLVDFGAADFISADGFNEACGTVLYAAPEMVPWLLPAKSGTKPKPYGKEVDCWAMGVLLFVMLSGEAPFEQEKSDEEILSDVLKGKVSMGTAVWSKISIEAKDVVLKLLAVSAAARATPTSLRTHKWYANQGNMLAPKAPVTPRLRLPPPEEQPEDLEVLAALGFLTKVFQPVAGAAGGPHGDLRLLVTPETSLTGIVAVYTIRLWGKDGAFVLPARQHEQPLAVVACSRAQLLRWVAGDAPLLPPDAHLPNNSALGLCLGCFSPEKQDFHSYMNDRGEEVNVPELKSRRSTRLWSSRAEAVPQWSHDGRDVLDQSGFLAKANPPLWPKSESSRTLLQRVPSNDNAVWRCWETFARCFNCVCLKCLK